MDDPTPEKLESSHSLAGQRPAHPSDGSGDAPPNSLPSPPPGINPLLLQLVEAHYAAVYRYAFRLAGSVPAAEDVTQQTFLQLQQKIDQIRDLDKARGWLYAVARTTYIKSQRRARPVPLADLQHVPGEPIDAIQDADEIDREQLHQCLNDLPDDYRLVLMMFFFEQLSYKEIAAQLELPLGTVMSRLSRAKSQLRKRLVDVDSEMDHPVARSNRSAVGGDGHPTSQMQQRHSK